GKAMALFSGRPVESCYRDGRPACGGNTIQTKIIISAEDNHAIFIPCTAYPRTRGLTDIHGGSAIHSDLLELSGIEKCDDAAVWRPKRIYRSLSRGQLARVQRIQIADPDLVLAISVSLKSNVATIRGDGWNGGRREGRSRGRQDVQLDLA